MLLPNQRKTYYSISLVIIKSFYVTLGAFFHLCGHYNGKSSMIWNLLLYRETNFKSLNKQIFNKLLVFIYFSENISKKNTNNIVYINNNSWSSFLMVSIDWNPWMKTTFLKKQHFGKFSSFFLDVFGICASSNKNLWSVKISKVTFNIGLWGATGTVTCWLLSILRTPYSQNIYHAKPRSAVIFIVFITLC